MIIPLGHIKIIYEKILKKSLKHNSTVIILVSIELDSLCATSILAVLYKIFLDVIYVYHLN